MVLRVGRPRPFASALLLLLAGALTGCDYFEKNTVIGQLLAEPEFETVGRVEVDAYDPDANVYTARASLPAFISPETGAAVGDTVVVTAGGGTTTFIYDAAQNAWTTGPALPLARSGALALVHGTRVVVVSGRLANGLPASTIDLLDTADVAAGWQSVAIPPIAGVIPAERLEVAAAVVGDLLFIVGGRDRDGVASADVTVFDLTTASTTQSFTHAEDVLPAPRVLAGAFAVPAPGNGPVKLHVVGGHAGDGAALATDLVIAPDFAFPVFEPQSSTSTPKARIDPQVVVGDDEVLVLWSRVRDFGREDAVELYDVSGGVWSKGPNYPRLLRLSTAVFSSGVFRVFGGLSSEESKGDAHALDLAAATPAWTELTPGRDRHAALGCVVGGDPLLVGGIDRHEKDREVGPF